MHAGKSAGLTPLVKRLGISFDDVLAFGDGDNDLCMLKLCGMSISPSNASPNAKAAAKAVSSWTNDEDCVYRELAKIYGQGGEEIVGA
jgi:hydroxymethylpyrimidine pyrophosphatase-like HAD family hydrolase